MGLRSSPIYFALAILAACAQVPVGRVSIIPGETSSIESAVRYEAADGVIPLVINPFTGTQDEAAAAIGSVLRLPPGWPRASFASTPRAELGRGVRLVLVFNALEPRLEVRELCRNADGIEIAGRAGTTRILAAFCIGSRLGRGASAGAAAPATMNPEFRALLADILQGVFRFRTRRPDSFS